MSLARIQKEAPDFVADAVVGDQFTTVRLSDYRAKGKYVLLYFYPLDFTFVCPTEIIAFNDKLAEFERRNVQLLGVSVDSKFSHLAFNKTPRVEGGLGNVKYPLVSDLNKSISKAYGVLLDDNSVSLRGLFLIDKGGILRHLLINDLPIGRSVDEAIRVIDALQYVETHGEVCPANWKPGSATIKPSVEGSKEYFAKSAT